MAWILFVSNRQKEVTLCYTARIPDLFYSNFAFQFNLHVLFFLVWIVWKCDRIYVDLCKREENANKLNRTR